MRLHDWTGFAALGAAIASLVELFRGDLTYALVWFLVAAPLGLLTRYWSQTYPGPMPHVLRWTLFVPRGNHSPRHLKQILEPRSGERLLEIGPGVGIHSIPIASSLAPGGTLDVLDVQQKMLDDLMRRSADAGVANITAKLGDARKLPYPDGSFDGAYLVGVLGEIPGEDQALRELRRVLKPNGRLAVGEVIFDPDYVPFGALRDRMGRAGFAFERKLGNAFSYLARFRPA